jgi:EpsD family peptidyl-prolyl cis-trans isomerase
VIYCNGVQQQVGNARFAQVPGGLYHDSECCTTGADSKERRKDMLRKGLRMVVVSLVVGFSALAGVCAQEKENTEPSQTGGQSVSTSVNLPEGILARVNGKDITLKEFDDILGTMPPHFRPSAKEDKAKLLDRIVTQEVLYQEAIKDGIDKEEQVRKRVEDAKRQIMMSYLIEKQSSKVPEVTDADIEGYYNSHKNEFMTAEQVKANEIIVKTEDEAKAVSDRLSKGEDFAKVVNEVSVAITKDKNGDMGYVSRGQRGREFDTVVFNLKVGDVSKVIKVPQGYQIVKVIEKKESQPKPLGEVKELIQRRVQSQKRNEAVGDFVEGLKKQSKIEKNESLIETPGAPPEEAPAAQRVLPPAGEKN